MSSASSATEPASAPPAPTGTGPATPLATAPVATVPAPRRRFARVPRDPSAPTVDRSSLVLAVILTCQLMVVLDATIVNVALPDMQSALHFSSTTLSWVLNAYTLTFGGLLLLGARTGDLLGRRRIFVGGIALFAVASLLGGLATSGSMLLAARTLQGVGGALAAPSSLALLTTMFPEGAARLRALGLFAAVSVGGGAVGLVAGGMLTQWASWRWVMFVNVPIAVVVVAVGRLVLPETERQRGRFDTLGAITSTIGIGALVYGFVRAASDGWSDSVTLGSFIGGALLLVLFVRTEMRAPEPITPLRLLADRSRTGANVARGLLFAGMFGMFFFLTQLLQGPLGYSSLKTGFAFLPLPTTVFLVSRVTSRVLVRKVDGKILMLIGTALGATGFLLATQLSGSSSYPHVLACLLLFAVGNGLSFVSLTSAALAGVPAADAGAASGLINVVQQLGGTLGVAVLVTVFGTATRHAAGTPAEVFVHGADHAFRASVVFLAAAFVLVATLVRSPKVG